MNPGKFFCGVVVFLSVVSSALAFDGSRAVSLSRGTELIAKWQPEQHLYTKGDVRLANTQLGTLEMWLDRYAPHWTVLLCSEAGGEIFRDREGKVYQGIDAVEHALGKELPNQTEFGNLTHPGTGEADGAFLIVFLAERQLSYKAGSAYDSRGLGEESFVGNLDRPAIDALRDGGRVADAVKDTIQNIDRQLERRIAAEKTAVKRQEETALQAVEAVEELFTYTSEKRQAFGVATGLSQGGLADPDIGGWRGRIAAARSSFDSGDFDAAKQEANAVEGDLRSYLGALEVYPEAEARFAELDKEMTDHPPHEEDEGEAALAQQRAQAALQAARQAHASGDPNYQVLMNSAGRELASVKASNQATLSRLAAEEAGRSKLKKFFAAVAGFFALCLSGLASVFNRRRRPSMDEATTLLEQRRAEFRGRRDRSFKLMDRTYRVVGTQADLEEAGITGATRELSEEVVHDVDDLFVMSSRVDRVLEEAQELVKPKGLVGKLHNLVGGGRFRKAANLLRDEPVTFSGDAAEIEAFQLEGESDRSAERGPLLNGKSKAFKLTFEELVGRVDTKAEVAEGGLDRIENSWDSFTDTMEELGAKTGQLAEIGHALEEDSDDGFFALEVMSEEVIPAVYAEIDEVAESGRKDPLTATEKRAPELKRQITEAADLATDFRDFRKQRIPHLRELAEELRGGQRETAWIPQQLEELSEQGDSLIGQCRGRSIAQEREELHGALGHLADNVGRARKLTARVGQTAPESIQGARDVVASTRQYMAQQFGVPAETILTESPELNPDVLLARAEGLLDPAAVAIDRGGVAAADAALDEVDFLTSDAVALATESREAFEQNPQHLEELLTLTRQLREREAAHREELETLRGRYATSAFQLRHADLASQEDEEASVAGHVTFVAESLRQAEQVIGEASEAQKCGHVFEAAALLESAADHLDDVELAYGRSEAQAAAIAVAERMNRDEFRTRVSQQQSLAEAVNDAKVTRPTQAALKSATLTLVNAKEAIEATHGMADPFATRSFLQRAEEDFSRVEQQIENDRESYVEADRTLAEASAQLEEAWRWVERSQADQIPDSAAIAQANGKIEQASARYQELLRVFDQSHGDWMAIESEAAKVIEAAAQQTALLKQELSRAKGAVDSLQLATREVQSARGWTGTFGVLINGSPGSSSLHTARDFLRQGLYDQAARAANAARSEAASAIAAARRREGRIRMERQAAERRRRQAAQQASELARKRRQRPSRSSGGGLGSMGGNRSSGSRSRSSGSSRSSFGGSGSGTRRSGW